MKKLFLIQINPNIKSWCWFSWVALLDFNYFITHPLLLHSGFWPYFGLYFQTSNFLGDMARYRLPPIICTNHCNIFHELGIIKSLLNISLCLWCHEVWTKLWMAIFVALCFANSNVKLIMENAKRVLEWQGSVMTIRKVVQNIFVGIDNFTKKSPQILTPISLRNLTRHLFCNLNGSSNLLGIILTNFLPSAYKLNWKRNVVVGTHMCSSGSLRSKKPLLLSKESQSCCNALLLEQVHSDHISWKWLLL